MRTKIDVNRRRWLTGMLMLPLTGALTGAWAKPSGTVAEVWKDASCGCCKDWIAHMEKSGFTVRLHDTGNTAMRARLGVPLSLGSCHTARIGDYAVEGHVPAREIERLLKEKPTAIGLAVPGMPIGSPGMDGAAYGGRKDPYDVLLVQRDGSTSIYQAYR